MNVFENYKKNIHLAETMSHAPFTPKLNSFNWIEETFENLNPMKSIVKEWKKIDLRIHLNVKNIWIKKEGKQLWLHIYHYRGL